jgi:hypothetical protein
VPIEGERERERERGYNRREKRNWEGEKEEEEQTGRRKVRDLICAMQSVCFHDFRCIYL